MEDLVLQVNLFFSLCLIEFRVNRQQANFYREGNWERPSENMCLRILIQIYEEFWYCRNILDFSAVDIIQELLPLVHLSPIYALNVIFDISKRNIEKSSHPFSYPNEIVPVNHDWMLILSYHWTSDKIETKEDSEAIRPESRASSRSSSRASKNKALKKRTAKKVPSKTKDVSFKVEETQSVKSSRSVYIDFVYNRERK